MSRPTGTTWLVLGAGVTWITLCAVWAHTNWAGVMLEVLR